MREDTRATDDADDVDRVTRAADGADDADRVARAADDADRIPTGSVVSK